MFDLQPTLTDDLVIIRPLTTEDRELLYALASDPLIWEQHQQKNRWTKTVFNEFFEGSIQSNGALVILDPLTNQLIGSTRFNPIEGTQNAIEIGWSFLDRNYWGGQYNRAIKSLLINYAFQFVDQIVFYINQDNIRSQKSVQKLGAFRLDEFPHQHPDMSRTETHVYIIDKTSWDISIRNYR